MQFLQNLSNNYKRAFLRLGKNLNGTYFVVRNKKIPKWVVVLSIPTMIYLYSLYFYNRIVKKPSVYYNDKSPRMVLMYESLIDILETKYFPTLWASNTHLNTYIGSIFRRNPDILFKRYVRIVIRIQRARDSHFLKGNDAHERSRSYCVRLACAA